MSTKLQTRAARRHKAWITKFRRALQADSRSISEIAREAGLAPASLREWRDGIGNPTLARAMAIEEVLGMNK